NRTNRREMNRKFPAVSYPLALEWISIELSRTSVSQPADYQLCVTFGAEPCVRPAHQLIPLDLAGVGTPDPGVLGSSLRLSGHAVARSQFFRRRGFLADAERMISDPRPARANGT